MKGPFVKIESSTESPVYIHTDSIQSIEYNGGSITIETESRTCYDVTHVNGVKCEYIDDVAEALNNTYEDCQCMEKLVTITTTTETVGIKIKDIENIYEDTEGIISIQTANSTLHNVTEVNGNHCDDVEEVVFEINDTIESC